MDVGALARPGWPLLVGLPDRPPARSVSTIITLRLASSWEFFTTLDYEWSAIRGHRPYRWTIWVRNDVHVLSDFVA